MNETEKGRAPGVTWRAILIGLILIPPNVFWVVEVECIWHSGHPTTISLFWNVVLNLFFLILINLIIKQFWPKAALSQGEMVTIYVILSIASGLAGHDFLQLTAPTLPHAYWFATPENEWQELFHPYIPKHLVVSKKEILLGYYEGKADFYQKDIIIAWLGPTLWWTSLFFALGLMMICINVLIRKQWTEHEKLAYPIIQLPMAITEQGGTSSFFKNRLLWIGFIIAGLLDVWHGLGIDFIKGQFTWCANQIAYPKNADITAIGFTIGGALFTFFLMLMRVRFIWWPFHPAGYALSMPFGVEYFWTCLIISSIVKWVVLKYGGISMHHKAKFFFFGVILGEYCVGAFWSAMSVIIGAPIYDFAPG